MQRMLARLRGFAPGAPAGMPALPVGGVANPRAPVSPGRMNLQCKAMKIRYETSRKITESQFRDVLRRSTLSERRPVDDRKCIRAMLRHADLLCTAWDGKKLIGVARSVTDFEYCCYLCDLAVDAAYQKRGIGRALIALTQSCLGAKAKIILLAAPKARTYYPKLGFEAHKSAWLLPARGKLK